MEANCLRDIRISRESLRSLRRFSMSIFSQMSDIIPSWITNAVRVRICIPVWKRIAAIGADCSRSANMSSGTLRQRHRSWRRDETGPSSQMQHGQRGEMYCSSLCVLVAGQGTVRLFKLARLLPTRAAHKAAQRDLYDYDSEKGLEAIMGVRYPWTYTYDRVCSFSLSRAIGTLWEVKDVY